MKIRILSLVCIAVLLFSLVACGNKTASPTETSSATPDTTAGETKKTKTVDVQLDLTAEWDKIPNEAGTLVQGCVVVRTAFLEEHPDAVSNFLAAYKSSVEYVNTNTEEAAALIAKHGIFANEAVAKTAIPKCNIAYLGGAEMKTAMQTYLNILLGVSANSIGGKLPADDFYYLGAAEAKEDAAKIKIFTLNGTTGFGMAKLMEDGNENYNIEVKTTSDLSTAVIPALIQGTVDIAALPTNAASMVYNKTNGGVKILAVNTLGCLYLVTTDGSTVSSLADLEGKTVYVPAQNPTFLFTHLLQANGLADKVTVDSSSFVEVEALRDAVAAGKVSIAVLPEPMVTIAKATAAKANQ